MSKTVVLLDVDKTIWFHSDTHALNVDLIKRLIQLDAKDVFLFTDMTLHNQVVHERLALIHTLEAFGLKVHGVVTPSDLLWNQAHIPTLLLEKTRDYLKHSFALNKPGTAFSFAHAEFNTSGKVSEETAEKSYRLCRAILPVVVNIMECIHVKGLLFELFLKYLGPDTQKIIVVDDRYDVLSSIRRVCKHQKSELTEQNISVDTIHVCQKNQGIYYCAGPTNSPIANQAANEPPEYKMSERGDIIRVREAIHRLEQDPTFFFKESRQTKARLIEQALLQALHLGCEDVTQDVGVRWALAKHRIFSFWGLKKTRSLSSIDDLPQKLGLNK